MTAVAFDWAQVPDPVGLAPCRLLSGHNDVLLAPGESVELERGPALAVVEIPGYKTYQRLLQLDRDSESLVLGMEHLEPEQLGSELPSAGVPSRAAVRVQTWEVPPGPAALRMRLSPDAKGLGITAEGAGTLIPLAVQVVSKRTPRRLITVPPLSPGESYHLTWYADLGVAPRPRLEPDDPGGQLLMEYLVAGRFDLASAAARAVEGARGSSNPLTWASPSYTQLLIGYAYALGRDRNRLDRWCSRTAAARDLAADGMLLSAEAAWRARDRDGALGFLTRAAHLKPPILILGAEIGLRLSTLLLTESPEEARSGLRTEPSSLDTDEAFFMLLAAARPQLRELVTNYLRVLVKADGEAATMSLPQTRATTTDLSGAPRLRRIRATLSYQILRLGSDVRLSFGQSHQSFRLLTLKGTRMQNEAELTTATPVETTKARTLGGPALWVAVFAVLLWLGFSIYMLGQTHTSEVSWSRIAWVFGSVESVAFAAAGALFGTSIQKDRAVQAESRANAAESTVEQTRDEATRGRALAAAIQADQASTDDQQVRAMRPGAGQGDPTAERHAQLARSLFGDLVIRN